MHLATALLSVTLPVCAAVLPSPIVEAATGGDEMVVLLDVCACVPILQFETYVGDHDPWTIAWTRETGAEFGICNVADCTVKHTPRPCKANFRIEVGWPEAFPSPCIGAASVGYRKEGQSWFVIAGMLDLARWMVPIDEAGGDPVPCIPEAEADGTIPSEGDGTISYLRMECPMAPNLLHQRFVKVREACKPCAGTAGTE